MSGQHSALTPEQALDQSVRSFRAAMDEMGFKGVSQAIKLQHLQQLVTEFPDYTRLLLEAMSPEPTRRDQP